MLFLLSGEVDLTDYFGFDPHIRTSGPDMKYSINATLPRPPPPKIVKDEEK